MHAWTAHCTIRQALLTDQPDELTGVVVVVDVLRAFTVAPLALAWGAGEVRCVATVEQALAARSAGPNRIAVGEHEHGRDVEGFDHNNSPSQLAEVDLAGKLVVHRTSHGTQGLARAAPTAEAVLAASFVCAGATVAALDALEPTSLTFLLTGPDNPDEDRALADYVTAVLRDGIVDATPYLDRVRVSETGQRFVGPEAQFAAADLDHAVDLDAVDFALLAEPAVDHVRLRPWSP